MKVSTMAMTLLGSSSAHTGSATDLRPVVGIYSAPFHHTATGCENGCDYVAASYVKWLEAAGAQSLPIKYDSTDAEIEAIFPQINGVLLPGGGSSLPEGAKKIVNMAIDAFDKNGTYFPVWGTCLGFEWLMEAVGGDNVLSGGFDSENITMALDLGLGAATSRLLGPQISVAGHRARSGAAAQQLQADLSNKANPPAMNNHQAGIKPTDFAGNKQLTSFFNVLSTNQDRKGVEFVSTVEAMKHPVYGTQWHPEKNNFEYGMSDDGTPYEVINHSPEAVYASQSLANFFVGECRRNAGVNHALRREKGTKFFNDYALTSAAAPEFQECYIVPL